MVKMSSLGEMKSIYVADKNDVIHLCQVHMCVDNMLETRKHCRMYFVRIKSNSWTTNRAFVRSF